MAQLKITSTVLNPPKDWADESYLIPHEPLRWDLLECEKVLDEKYFDGTVQWKVDAFYKWYDTFLEIVHHHHDTEEKIFFPAIQKKCAVPDRMSKDHVDLLKMMDNLKSSKSLFDSAKSAESRKAAAKNLRDLWSAFTKEMLQHLAEEERVLVPLIREHMTEAEHDKLLDTILSSMGLSGNALMLPWVIRSLRVWKGDAETEKFKKVIPAPIRFLNDWFWTPAYEKNNWGLLHSIQGKEQPKSGTSMATAAVVLAGALTVSAYLYSRSH